MGEMKKYMSVERLGHRNTIGVLNDGDYITITEKIDGANSSFRREDDHILAFSRNTPLDESNNLRGFWNWTQTLDAYKLLEGCIYFGEWLVSHKVQYGKEYMNKFYLFDIYNTYTDEYVDFQMVKDEAHRLELNLIPLFYEGEYKGYEHLETFIGKTALGGKVGEDESGEGIVVKNINYKDRFGNQVFVKLVTDKFREVQKQKAPKDPNQPQSEESKFVSECLTKARVDKMLHKLVDEGILDVNFGIEDMGVILKNLGAKLFDDMLKEESDMLPKEYDEKEIRKSIGKKLPLIVKEIING